MVLLEVMEASCGWKWSLPHPASPLLVPPVTSPCPDVPGGQAQPENLFNYDQISPHSISTVSLILSQWTEGLPQAQSVAAAQQMSALSPFRRAEVAVRGDRVQGSGLWPPGPAEGLADLLMSLVYHLCAGRSKGLGWNLQVTDGQAWARSAALAVREGNPLRGQEAHMQESRSLEGQLMKPGSFEEAK